MKLSRPARDRLIAAIGALAIVVFLGGIFLIAKACDVPEYTVTYYDGSKVISTETVCKDKKARKWNYEDAEGGRTFDCWVTTENGEEEYDFDKPVTGDLKLYVRWKE